MYLRHVKNIFKGQSRVKPFKMLEMGKWKIRQPFADQEKIYFLSYGTDDHITCKDKYIVMQHLIIELISYKYLYQK